MKTSSSVGRDTLTDLIGDAELREQPRHELLAGLDEERDRALRPRRLDPEALDCSASIAASSSAVWIRTRSAPTLRLQRLRRVEHDDLAVVHDRDAVAELRLVHVVRRHEDRDLLRLAAARGCSARSSCASAGRGRSSARRGTARAASAAGRGRSPAAGACRPRTSAPASRAAPTGRPSRAPGACARGRGRRRRRRARRAGCRFCVGGEVAVERRLLEDEPDVAADVVALGDDVVARHARAAAGRLRERAEHVDRGRLARRRWARGTRTPRPARRRS